MPLEYKKTHTMKRESKKNRQRKLSEIIQLVEWEEVAEELVGCYPSKRKNLEEYRKVFEYLRELKPVGSMDKIVISAFRPYTDYFPSMYIVYRKHDKLDNEGPLAFAPWAKWLGMRVCFNPDIYFSDELIAAVCLYEICFYGFTEADVQKERLAQEEEMRRIEETCPIEEESGAEDDILFPYCCRSSQKEVLSSLKDKLLRERLAEEYFGQNVNWFEDHFLAPSAPSDYEEIDRRTLKSALLEIAQELVKTSYEL